MQAQKECDTCLLRRKSDSVFFLQRLEYTLTLSYNHKHTYCAAHMLVTVSVHIQRLDTQLCQDKSIILSYYAASDAGENCMPHPSSVLYFLLKINRQINKSEIYSHLRSCRGEFGATVQGDLKSHRL